MPVKYNEVHKSNQAKMLKYLKNTYHSTIRLTVPHLQHNNRAKYAATTTSEELWDKCLE